MESVEIYGRFRTVYQTPEGRVLPGGGNSPTLAPIENAGSGLPSPLSAAPTRGRLMHAFRVTLALGALLAAAILLRPSDGLQASADASDAAIRNAVETILDDDALPDTYWGLYVQNLRTGEVVVSRNADKNFIPASNLKLLTTATALDALGPTHRYVTRLYFDGTARDSTLRGDLILRGSGDPSLGSQLAGADPLAAWAAELKGLGVARVEGRNRRRAWPGWDGRAGRRRR